ncbi:uncharacterized protein MICPUCDRAFT_55454 [Micromonas pusilla CCMP1545]|uniref:Predicted protein n=1 Tax=Micromonas pusilla (strain CCMP1545) TaxID=564608 RepID=C1MKT5_MICPC|nr:uncharacterized protein MICPUCDRAFT_55454 [Micromonas pusilla CCMP1545]EEH59819.1 predicted protein [Micromonas pusilla CCMP1545]|eukprot:XP_003056443.1 predicted protein [Micromonas pusilla CCMP1545]
MTSSVQDAADIITIKKQDTSHEQQQQLKLCSSVLCKSNASGESNHRQISPVGSLVNNLGRFLLYASWRSGQSNVIGHRARSSTVVKNSLQHAISRVAFNDKLATCVRCILESLRNGKHEVAVECVETLHCLRKSESRESADTVASSVSYEARLVELRDVVANVVRQLFAAATQKRDVQQVLNYGKLFPRLQLAKEGLKKISDFVSQEVKLEIERHGSEVGGGLKDVLALSNLYQIMFSCIETFHDEIKRSFGSEAFSNLLDKLDEQANKNGEIILLNFLGSYSDLQFENDQQDRKRAQKFMDDSIDIFQLLNAYKRFLWTRFFLKSRVVRGTYEHLRVYAAVQALNLRKTVKIVLDLRLNNVIDDKSFVDDVFFVFDEALSRAWNSGHSFLFDSTLREVFQIEIKKISVMISSSWFSQTKINQFSQAKLEDILAFILFCDSISQSLRILIAKFKACDGFHSLSKTHYFEKDFDFDVDNFTDTADILCQQISEKIIIFAKVLLDRFRVVLDVFSRLSYVLDDYTYLLHEQSDPWLQNLFSKIDEASFSQTFRDFFFFLSYLYFSTVTYLTLWRLPVSQGFDYVVPVFPNTNFFSFYSYNKRISLHVINSILSSFIELLASSIEDIIFRRLRFSQLGGLQLEREIRRFILHLSSTFPEVAVREKCARLLHISSVLSVESPVEVSEYWEGLVGAPKLSILEMKRILHLRVDFKIEQVDSFILK